MADTPGLSAGRAPAGVVCVRLLQAVLVAAALIGWEMLSRSGWFFRDVVPSLAAIGGALANVLQAQDFYWHLGVSASEITIALAIGGAAGIVAGLVLGSSPLLGRAFEPYLIYLGPTPKIVFFPILIMWFGVGPGSKIAMGTLSCFFPIALSVAAGLRQIDPVIIQVGRSFRANALQMAMKIYLPAMRQPIMNGVRLGLGVAVIGTLLAETKLSNRGVGFLIINSYATFDMPRMYALVIVVFVLAIAANAFVARFGTAGR
jgi:NitT/TauT family transport system permease protein